LVSGFLIRVGVTLAKMGGWIKLTQALLSREQWRSAPARLLGRIGPAPVIEVADGPEPVCLRLVGAAAEVGLLIDRSQQVDLLGSRATKGAMVRVPALRWPMPAKVLRSGTPVKPLPEPAAGPAGTAAEDPLVASWANRLERLSRWDFAMPVVLLSIAAWIAI